MQPFDPFAGLDDFTLVCEAEGALTDLFALLELHQPDWWTLGYRMDTTRAIAYTEELARRIDERGVELPDTPKAVA